MADASILTTWGQVFSGRETMGLGVFQGVIAYFEGLKSKGQIEEFKVGLAENGSIVQHSGYMLIEGSVAQLRAVLDSEDYKRLLVKASHVVPFTTAHHVTGNGVMQAVERMVSVRNELGIK